MSEVPAARPAPYPPDTLARGWRFEVDMEKVKRSETWTRAKTGEVRGALLLLWGESWQQVPCGTLPNDDELVALIIDMPAAKFAKHRAVLMRGWWLASDGRLYHETITDRVLAMLDKRATDAERAANYRARKASRTGESVGVTGESRVTHTGDRSEFDTKHQAQDTKHKVVNTPPKPPRKRRGAGQRICPDEFVVTADMEAWAATNAPGVSIERETVKFRNHEFDKPKTEWSKTWMNWMLRAQELGGASPEPRTSRRAATQPAQSFAERDRLAGMERWEQMTGRVHPDRAPPVKRLSDVIDEPLQTLPALGAPA